jgi:hypothetical protein
LWVLPETRFYFRQKIPLLVQASLQFFARAPELFFRKKAVHTERKERLTQLFSGDAFGPVETDLPDKKLSRQHELQSDLFLSTLEDLNIRKKPGFINLLDVLGNCPEGINVSLFNRNQFLQVLAARKVVNPNLNPADKRRMVLVRKGVREQWTQNKQSRTEKGGKNRMLPASDFRIFCGS